MAQGGVDTTRSSIACPPFLVLFSFFLCQCAAFVGAQDRRPGSHLGGRPRRRQEVVAVDCRLLRRTGWVAPANGGKAALQRRQVLNTRTGEEEGSSAVETGGEGKSLCSSAPGGSPTSGRQNPSLCILPRSPWVLPHGAPCAAPLAAPRLRSPAHRRLTAPVAPRTSPSGRVRTACHARRRSVAPAPKFEPRVQVPRGTRVQIMPQSRVQIGRQVASCVHRRRPRTWIGLAARPPPSAVPADRQPPHVGGSPFAPGDRAPSRPRGRLPHSQHSPAGSRLSGRMAQAPCRGNTLPVPG